jgi:hypothetical protein
MSGDDEEMDLAPNVQEITSVPHKETTLSEEFVDDPTQEPTQPTITDDDDEEEEEVETTKRSFPIRETVLGPIKFNWLVSMIGLVVLWGFAIFCMTSKNAGAVLGKWYDATILYFTWFYIVGKIR